MAREPIEKRDSRALEPQLITDPQARAEAEARNVLRQYDAGIAAIQSALERRSFKLRPSLILALHREALTGISIFAGNFRPAGNQGQPASTARGSSRSRISRRPVRLRQRTLGAKYANPFGLVCDVAAQLDTPFRRWKRKNVTHCVVRRSIHPRGGNSTRYTDNPRSDRR